MPFEHSEKSKDKRPSWDEYFLDIAMVVAINRGK